MNHSLPRMFFLALVILFSESCALAKPLIIVGSKPFTESYVLSEIIAQTIEDAGEAIVQRKAGLGATGIVFESLKSGQISIYPEYTGTITEAILKNSKSKKISDINMELAPFGLAISGSLGFNDSYALAITRTFAEKNNIKKISDLKKFPDIRAGFTHEFLKRSDGFEPLRKCYGLVFNNFKGMEHSLAYESLAQGKIDLIEVYSTDAKVNKYNLVILHDDKEYFPKYLGVLFYRKDAFTGLPKTTKALKKLEGLIVGEKMIELNAKVELQNWSFEKTAAYFLNKKFDPSATSNFSAGKKMFVKRTKEHLSLVFISLAVAIMLGIPLGICAAKFSRLAQVVLLVSGLLQTIPSLALLCFLIPLFGIGYTPAVVALFLYALLPIVRSTYLGLKTIDPRLIESSRTLGLSGWNRLLRIEIPLASPSILSGIKLSAVINVGTATLAAFIGAGGYGAIIVTGLALNDDKLILQGAIPSAVLALLVHGFFELMDKLLIPKGIRQ